MRKSGNTEGNQKASEIPKTKRASPSQKARFEAQKTITEKVEKVDELLDKASTGMNLQERKEYFQEAWKLIHPDAPWIFGYSQIYGVRKSVVNWRPTPDGRMNMHDVYLGISSP